MKLYDLIKELLEKHPQLRNSDKKLMWSVWYKMGYAGDMFMYKTTFLDDHVPTPESITRCRRKIQEKHPGLQADKPIEGTRKAKAREKGTFIYREKVKSNENGFWDYSTGTAKWVEY